jgi:uncharacterized protein (TIGR02246 family)
MSLEQPEHQDAIACVNRRVMTSFAAKVFEELAACYTEDARILVARAEPIVGKAAIQAVFALIRKRIHRIDIITQNITTQGEVAIEDGLYFHRAADGATLDHGKYLVTWKQIDGQWLIHRDMLVSDV